MIETHCQICYTSIETDIMACDICDKIYCEDCSYTFTIYYQHEGSRCFLCSGQKRLKSLSKENIRDNKLKIFLSNQ